MIHPKMNVLWVVGRWGDETSDATTWGLVGEFDTYKEAVKACLSDKYFLFQVEKRDYESQRDTALRTKEPPK